MPRLSLNTYNLRRSCDGNHVEYAERQNREHLTQSDFSAVVHLRHHRLSYLIGSLEGIQKFRSCLRCRLVPH